MNAKRRRAHQKLAALPGVRSVRRPVSPDSGDEFDLYYVRTGRKSAHPLVIIPGGPGAASVALYRGAASSRRRGGSGRDHGRARGVGMSRHDDAGADLPPRALTIDQVVDDIVAVLDDAHVDKAILYGTSYGTYIAAGVGVRHPQRVHAMILDSPLLSGDDIDEVRAAIRRVLWDGNDSDTADLAPKVRQLVDEGVLTPAAGQLAAADIRPRGSDAAEPPTGSLLSGRRGLWTVMGGLGPARSSRKRRRTATSPIWWAASASANSTTVACPTASRWTRRRPTANSPSNPVEFEAEPYDLVQPRCRSSPGRPSSFRAAAT